MPDQHPDETTPPGPPDARADQPPAGTPARRSAAPGNGKPPHTRTGAAWVGIWAAIVFLALLIVFILQNTDSVQVDFLWMEGSLPLALALLIAGVGVGLATMVVGAARVTQLRRELRRHGPPVR